MHPEYSDIPDELAVFITRAAGSPRESVHITENIIICISQLQSTPTCNKRYKSGNSLPSVNDKCK
jgi:hypothetical protein